QERESDRAGTAPPEVTRKTESRTLLHETFTHASQSSLPSDAVASYMGLSCLSVRVCRDTSQSSSTETVAGPRPAVFLVSRGTSTGQTPCEPRSAAAMSAASSA